MLFFFHRTHKGSGERVITLEHLKQVGHLPQQQAADHLNVGNTRFKMATRQLGMKAWPYRKIKSIRNLIFVVEQNTEYFPVSNSVCTALIIFRQLNKFFNFTISTIPPL
jgi:hypothetical protein